MATLLRKLLNSLKMSANSQGAAPEATAAAGFDHFPEELLCAIFLQLGPKDLVAAGLVCRFWQSVSRDETIWESLLRKDCGNLWPFVLFVETCLREDISLRFLTPEAALPFCKIFKQRRLLSHSLVVDGGSGYCKYGLGNKFLPEGKLATFLEFGNIDTPLAPRISNFYQTIFNRMQRKASQQPIIISTPICQNDDTDIASAMRRQYREITFAVLFDLGAPAVCAVNQAVLALYAAMKTSGLVVNIGFHVTSVVPVLNGMIMRNIGVEVIGQGALGLTGYLSELMHQNGTNFTSMYAVRTLKERLCYVAEDYEAELQKDTTASCDVGQEGNFTLREERFKTGEILFRPSLSGMRAMGLHHAVGLCMEHCEQFESPDDAQQGWYKTIVLAGGSACLPGLAGRLAKELRDYLPSSLADGLTVIPPMHGPYGAWIGAKFLSNMSSFPNTWCVSRKKYRKHGPNIVHAMTFDDN